MNKRQRFVFYGLLFVAVSVILQFTYFASGIFLIRPVNEHFFLSPLSVFSLILFCDILIIDFLKYPKFVKPSQRVIALVFAGLLYLLVILGTLVVIFIIKNIYLNTDLNFTIEALFDIGAKEIMWFIVFINILITYFLFSLVVYKWLNELDIPLKKRFVLALVLILISTVFIFLFTDIEVFTIFLSYLIYFFLLDYFAEQKQINSSWLFSWLIVIAGFTTLIIYYVYSIQQNEYRSEEIKHLIYTRNDSLEKKLLSLKTIGRIEAKGMEYYAEIVESDTFQLLNRLNKGFVEIDEDIYFNPVNGDYTHIMQGDKKDFFHLLYLYNITDSSIRNINYFQTKYIILHHGKVLFNNTDVQHLKIPEQIIENKVESYKDNGYLFFHFKNKDGNEVIEVKKIPGILRPLSLFSLVFILTGIFWFIIAIFNTVFRFLPSIIDLNFSNINSLKTKIQFSIIGLLIVSFFILGIITFHYFYNYNIQNKKNESGNILSLAASNMELSSFKNIYTEFSNKLLDMERESGISMFFYDKNGELLKDPRRNYSVFDKFPAGKDLSKILKEDGFLYDTKYIYDKKYLLAFIPLLDIDKTIGYLGHISVIDNSSVMAASDILSNFLNIYVLLLLLSGAIAITLANSISKPIDILGEKMEFLSLNQNNELIDWNKQDELGKLIRIYNITVKKLKESAKIITKIERDAAWRDMAKQVAHEIKNPLTPLKLNIQYLQSFVNRNPESAREMVNQIAPSLIEQINNLDKIATEFSDFAKMPNARNEKVNLNEIAKIVHDFFRKRDDLDFQLIVPINDLIVFADKNHIVSILNNIIKNAIQAIPNDRTGKIIMELYKEKENSIIKISDNGSGISDDMKDKVFSPNFTTKSSGTGLGLAISSSMIQSFNGKIYFETELNVGTTFFIEIPLMRIKENKNGAKRVSLDD